MLLDCSVKVGGTRYNDGTGRPPDDPAGVILAGVVIVLSGLSIWKPVQFQELTALFGGYDTARYVHFFAMAAIVGFLIVHVALALIVPRSLRAMVTGR